jgi:hypothetical protein
MPPEAMTARNSNCRSFKGSITGWPHLGQGVVESGAKVLGMKMLLPHLPHGTIFRDEVPPVAGFIDTAELMLLVKGQ